jgi:blocked early in transport 1
MSDTHRRFNQNDELEESLRTKTSKLKDIALNLGNEIKDSNKLIDGLNGNFDNSNKFIKDIIKGISKLPQYSNFKLYVYILLFALFVFFVLYLIIR